MAAKYPSWVVEKSHKRMYDDFRYFLYFIWKELGLPPPTEVQYDIALYLQTGDRRIIIEAFRGVGKSWITAAFALWLLWRDPQHKIEVVSAAKERADAFSIFVKALIVEIPMLKFLEPRTDQRTSNLAFDVAPAKPDQSPSVKSVGINGQLTGSRADTIIADDIEVPKNSGTETQRYKISEAVKEFDAVLKPNGRVIYLGTPQVAESLYPRLESRGYVPRIWPSRYPEDPSVYRGFLAPMLQKKLDGDPSIVGKPTDPVRFDDLDLQEREASYGRSGFALQFQLDTSLSDANKYPLKLKDLIVMDTGKTNFPVQLEWAGGRKQRLEDIENLGLNGDCLHEPMYISEEYAGYTGSLMVIDPSGRGKDETSYCVTKMSKGMIVCRRSGGLKGGYDDTTLKALAVIARDEGVSLVRIEDNFGDGMFIELFKPVLRKYHRCTVEPYKVSGQKEARIIAALEPTMNQHRLVIDRSIMEEDVRQAKECSEEGAHSALFYTLSYQLTHITNDRGCLNHDDRIDALAESVKYWNEQVGLDITAQEEAHMDKLREEDFRDFMKSCKALGGRVRKNKNWMGKARR